MGYSTIEVMMKKDSGRFLILINGVELSQHISKHESHCEGIAAIGILPDTEARFLGQAEPDLPDGYTAILVCSVCGDLSCGAVAARIRHEGGHVCWDDMAIRNDYDGEGQVTFQKVRGFKFEAEQYRRAITRSE